MFPFTNLGDAFAGLERPWSPVVIGQVNDHYVKAAKLHGRFVWHDHAEDEMFVVVRGSLRIEYRDRSIDLREGDVHTVPRRTEHNPVAEEECWVLLVEPVTTRHTGDVRTERTRSVEEQLRTP